MNGTAARGKESYKKRLINRCNLTIAMDTQLVTTLVTSCFLTIIPNNDKLGAITVRRKSKDIYNNRAAIRRDTVTTEDCTDFECCPEELVFAMKDNHHHFSLGLTTVIECLQIAEIQGYVPKLPQEWWCKLRRYD